MSAQDHAAVAHALYEIYNTRDFERGAALIDEQATWTNMATGQTFQGPEGYKAFVSGWAGAFPDSQVVISTLNTAGDIVVCEFKGQGVHTGPLMSPTGPIPPTHRPIDVPFCEVLQMRDGRVVAARTYFDLATLLRQLGLIE